uniref:Uncharacterized protein n=2 Tax=unclassified Mycobacterium TaxID=2642494 RepID=A0A5Q5BQR0_MYCSS
MSPPASIDKEIAEDIVRACVAHQLSLLQINGKFVYAHKHLAPSEISTGYNLLRHCGTVWFMCKAIRSLAIDTTSHDKQKLRAAVAYILARMKEPAWIQRPLPALCLTAKDVVKLGGSGLAAVMLREHALLADHDGHGSWPLTDERSHDETSDDNYEPYCTGLENYLLSQLKGTDFIHKRAFSTGHIYSFRSEYYTGEALLALMRSPRHIPRVRVTMENLLDRGYGLAQQSHWMAYAACASLTTGYCDETKTVVYLGRLVESILFDRSYRKRRESTPIACRTEALVEILNTRLEVGRLRNHLSRGMIDAATTTVFENLSLQLEYYRDGQFRKGDTSDKVQIDYIQHNAASLLGWWHLISHSSA